jgi:hypothetical protein
VNVACKEKVEIFISSELKDYEDYVHNIPIETGHSSVYKRTGSVGGDSYPYVSEV